MKPVNARLLRDEAYQRLREAILSGELAPGASLRVEGLARELELSSMPVREALARLRDEGLVEIRPRSGTRVAPLRLGAASQALAVITAMHELAARTAVPRLEAVHLEQLAAAGERFEAAVKAGDYEAAIRADDDFHGLFVEVAANRPLTETLDRYMPTLRRAEAMRFGTLPGRKSVAAHALILDAARRRDVPAAVQATRENWASLGAQIEQSMADEETGDQA
jgi:DNA-binding GntR family transcriptional regulator